MPNVACTRAGVATLAAILFLAAGKGDRTTGADLMQAATTPESRREMITALPATGPRPSLGDQARVFDRFVGTWDTEYIAYADDGSVSRMPGEVRFGWVLDGWALQDIWITYPDGASRERNIGTTLRFYDEEAGTWRIIWVYPARRRTPSEAATTARFSRCRRLWRWRSWPGMRRVTPRGRRCRSASVMGSARRRPRASSTSCSD